MRRPDARPGERRAGSERHDPVIVADEASPVQRRIEPAARDTRGGPRRTPIGARRVRQVHERIAAAATVVEGEVVAPAGRRTQLRTEAIPRPDRKSTRLNSSHSQISYAVFCLKKKKKQQQRNT